MRIYMALVVGILSASPALGGNPAYGAGTLECSYMLKHIKIQEARSIMLGWFGGYITGRNYELIRRSGKYADTESLNEDLIIGHLISGCTADPSLRVWQSADKLIRTLPEKSL